MVESLKEYFDSEPCGDVISREKAKQFLYEKLDRLNDNELYDIFSRIIDDMYNELPPVTPQQKVGKWIEEKSIWDDNSYQCSECGRSIHLNWDEDINDYPYCHCGVKMEVSENE